MTGKLQLGACVLFGRPAYYPRTSRIIGGSFIFLVLETQRNALPAVNLRKYTVRNNNPIIAEGKTPTRMRLGQKYINYKKSELSISSDFPS